jgi:hypothetical protein
VVTIAAYGGSRRRPLRYGNGGDGAASR